MGEAKPKYEELTNMIVAKAKGELQNEERMTRFNRIWKQVEIAEKKIGGGGE